MFHLLSNTANSYLSDLMRIVYHLTLLRNVQGPLNEDGEHPRFVLFSAFTGVQAQAWQLDFTEATMHTSRWDTHLPQIPLEEKIGIANLIRFRT